MAKHEAMQASLETPLDVNNSTLLKPIRSLPLRMPVHALLLRSHCGCALKTAPPGGHPVTVGFAASVPLDAAFGRVAGKRRLHSQATPHRGVLPSKKISKGHRTVTRTPAQQLQDQKTGTPKQRYVI
eukprot:6489051-Amphidinium_carterae.1